jgi:hypothetical protein
VRTIRSGICISKDRLAHLRLRDAEHDAEPWRVHEITKDGEYEAVLKRCQVVVVSHEFRTSGEGVLRA